MKIRIKDNSIRLRLTKSDINSFCENGLCEYQTNFGNRQLVYSLKADENYKSLSAEFIGNKITITAPSIYREEWLKDEIIGFEHAQLLENGDLLLLKIEKDFTCLDRTTEDQSDQFPNPKLADQ